MSDASVINVGQRAFAWHVAMRAIIILVNVTGSEEESNA